MYRNKEAALKHWQELEAIDERIQKSKRELREALKEDYEEAERLGFHETDIDYQTKTVWFLKDYCDEDGQWTRWWKIIGIRGDKIRRCTLTDSHMRNTIIPWL